MILFYFERNAGDSC